MYQLRLISEEVPWLELLEYSSAEFIKIQRESW